MATLIFFVGAIIFLAWLFGSDHSKPESPYKYEVKNEPPQLPPLNYDVEPDNDWEVEYFNAKNPYGGIEEPFRTYFQLSGAIQRRASLERCAVECKCNLPRRRQFQP